MRLSPTSIAWLSMGTGVCIAVVAAMQAPRSESRVAPGGHDEADEHVPVLSPEESQVRFQLQPGFRIELVASEPMIEAPVAAAFDESGRLWVVEMRTYMPDVEGTGELEPRNRILILEDTDGDGKMDKSTVFLDDLVLPRGVAPTHGGALVIEPPNLLFCRNTDGDGKADERRVLLDGFAGRESPEHAGNGPIYGIDNWWEFSQHSSRVWFDGATARTQKTPVHGQWGITRDNLGLLFYTPNSNPLLVDLFPKHYASRPGAAGSASGLGESIGKDGTTWPAIPTPTVNRGYRDGTLRADGTLASVTAACGPTMFRSGAFGEEFLDNVFICEPAGQLVKRLVLSLQDDSFDAVNIYKNGEFARSTDERFRPVNSLVGPDGNLYILDMYRGLIQHRMFLTPHLKDITRRRGMETPINCGRIWRIVRDDPAAERNPVAPGALPASCDNDTLVDLLASGNGWWRDTAQRLLVERRAVDVAPQLRSLAGTESVEGSVRVEAMWVLHGLGLMTQDEVQTLADSRNPAVRTAALRIAESLGPAAALERLIQGAMDDADPGVRVQAALSIGQLADRARPALAASAYCSHGGERLVRSALRTSIGGKELDVLRVLLASDGWPADSDAKAILRELTDAVLNASPQRRSELVELSASLVLGNDARGELFLERFKAKVRLDSDEPAPLKLDREPLEWNAAAKTNLQGAALMRRCGELFEWKGHEIARVKRIVRDLTSAEWDLFNQGKKLFGTTCASCHQPEGQGSAGLAPPLAGSSIASGPGGRMVRIVLHGLEGGYMPGGGSWGVMPVPAIKESGQIAAILTYVRRSWGNTGDPVTPAMVAKIRQQTKDRQKPWSRDELNGVKE